jgi:hypothetical protein
LAWCCALLGAVGCGDEANSDGSDGGAEGAVTKGDDLDDEGEPPPPPPSACEAACAIEQTCLGESLEGCLATCATDHSLYSSDRGAQCVGSFETLLQCIGALDCAGAAAFADGYAEAYPCELEEENFVDLCLLQGEPPPAACVAICAKTGECAIGDVSECEAACAQQLAFAEALSADCATAQTDLLVCVEALECADLDGYYESDTSVCADLTAQAAAVCAM